MGSGHLYIKISLSYPHNVGSFHLTNGYYGTGNSPIISEVYCYNSNSFNSCGITHQGYCSQGEEVGVVCQGKCKKSSEKSHKDRSFDPVKWLSVVCVCLCLFVCVCDLLASPGGGTFNFQNGLLVYYLDREHRPLVYCTLTSSLNIQCLFLIFI